MAREAAYRRGDAHEAGLELLIDHDVAGRARDSDALGELVEIPDGVRTETAKPRIGEALAELRAVRVEEERPAGRARVGGHELPHPRRRLERARRRARADCEDVDALEDG